MNKKIIGIIGLGGLGALLYYTMRGRAIAPAPSPTGCKEGSTKCIGTNLYMCKNGKWVLYEINSTKCGYKPTPRCAEGQTKCVGYDLYVCHNGQWVLKEKNSVQCGCAPQPQTSLVISPSYNSVLLGGHVNFTITKGYNASLTYDIHVDGVDNSIKKVYQMHVGNIFTVQFSNRYFDIGKYYVYICKHGTNECSNKVEINVTSQVPNRSINYNIRVIAYYPKGWVDVNYNPYISYKGTKYPAILVQKPPTTSQIGNGNVWCAYKPTGKFYCYDPSQFYATKGGFLAAYVTMYKASSGKVYWYETIYPVLADIYIDNKRIDWNKASQGMWVGANTTAMTGKHTIYIKQGENIIASKEFDIPYTASNVVITVIPSYSIYKFEVYYQ